MFEFDHVQYKEILDIPDLQIDRGITTAIVGPSGSGKTTLLRLMNKLISPTAGQILYDGKVLESLDSVLHRRSVTMLSQQALVVDGTIEDNLKMAFALRGVESPDTSALQEALMRVQLEKTLGEEARRLSGGEQQRLALARLLLLNPEVYLLDEPSAALDSKTEIEIIEMLTKHAHENGKTMIMVTHATQIAERYAQVVIQLQKGRAEKRQV